MGEYLAEIVIHSFQKTKEDFLHVSKVQLKIDWNADDRCSISASAAGGIKLLFLSAIR